MNRTPALLALATMSVIGVAIAANAHYVRGPNATLDKPGVVVTWKSAGLGDNVLEEYRADAVGSARYQCVNNGGKCPAAANKQEVHGNVSAFGAFSSGKNGTINGSLALDPPAATLRCPGGQHRELTAASFTDITLTDLTSGPANVPTDPDHIAFSGPECP